MKQGIVQQIKMMKEEKKKKEKRRRRMSQVKALAGQL